ncbi:hypothetical protein EIN_074370 [Entamoeba invadens IP1]|uniref:Uncharacterized protein n=1 Tax=Entamoeba invadens IP1 TaxID=370355 RepID=A0A0A1UBK5_ENTIV|nr:hypothetical protein EIN_074370 [Entamoeba invadens IP1]ELP92594.1 hypothetical protein EIN_074370 [Entamoeba invadens IP1]|eukprot:XP_004259365.1 hypothetical protein EIN_074370 [Entamoeba invadens IP1]
MLYNTTIRTYKRHMSQKEVTSSPKPPRSPRSHSPKRKKWDVVNTEFLRTLKEQGQNISVAITDPTQALIVVPQQFALATIGQNDLDAFLKELKKGTFEYTKSICINHLNPYLRGQLLKSVTHEFLMKEFNVHVFVKGNYQEDFHGTEFDPDDNSTYVNKCGQTPLYLFVKGDTPRELEEGEKNIRALFNGRMRLEVYPPRFVSKDEEALFAQMIEGKDRTNVAYIEKKNTVTIILKGAGSPDVDNDEDGPLAIEIVGTTPIGILKSRGMCRSLIECEKRRWNKMCMKEQMKTQKVE